MLTAIVGISSLLVVGLVSTGTPVVSLRSGLAHWQLTAASVKLLGFNKIGLIAACLSVSTGRAGWVSYAALTAQSLLQCLHLLLKRSHTVFYGFGTRAQ